MPASSAYTSHELVAHRGEFTIYGQYFLPANYESTQKLPVVVCAHGLGSNYLHVVSYAWDLAPRGFAVYCFDFCGGGYASRSSGNPINMSLATERDDIVSVMHMIARRPEVDPTKVFLLGEGQGGFAATMALHDDPTLARALVLLYPAFYLHDDARHTFPTPKNVPVSYRQRGMRVGRGFGQAAWETNPYTQMRGYPGDVLIVHGDEDAVCPIEYSQRAVEVFPHAELTVIHGGKHAFRDKALEKSQDAVREFLAREVEQADAQRVDTKKASAAVPPVEPEEHPAEASAPGQRAAGAEAADNGGKASLGGEPEASGETVGGAHFAPAARPSDPQQVRGRHSVHKTRRPTTYGRHFRS